MSQEENSSPQKKKKGKKSMSSIGLEGVVKKFTDKEVSPSLALIGSINASYFLVKNIFLNW